MIPGSFLIFIRNIFAQYAADRCHLVFFVGRAVPVSVSVCVKARNDMDMRMEDELSRRAVVVHCEVDTVCVYRTLHNRSEVSDCFHEGTKIFPRDVIDICGVGFGDDQCVAAVDRMDIEEGVGRIIFVDFFRGNSSGNNIAKETIVFHICIAAH